MTRDDSLFLCASHVVLCTPPDSRLASGLRDDSKLSKPVLLSPVPWSIDPEPHRSAPVRTKNEVRSGANAQQTPQDNFVEVRSEPTIPERSRPCADSFAKPAVRCPSCIGP